jgi:hypothetical protein
MLAMILLGGNDKAGQPAKVFCGVFCGLMGSLPGHQLGNRFLVNRPVVPLENKPGAPQNPAKHPMLKPTKNLLTCRRQR